jgi:hypothetical protein
MEPAYTVFCLQFFIKFKAINCIRLTMFQLKSYYHYPNAHSSFVNINVPSINFACINAQLKNCYRKATVNINKSLYWGFSKKINYYIMKPCELIGMDCSDIGIFVHRYNYTNLQVCIMSIDIIKEETSNLRSLHLVVDRVWIGVSVRWDNVRAPLYHVLLFSIYYYCIYYLVFTSIYFYKYLVSI